MTSTDVQSKNLPGENEENHLSQVAQLAQI